LNLVAPLLGRGNKINPGHRRKANSIPGVTLGSPRSLNGWRLTATGLMPCRPFPVQSGSDNANDVSRIQFLYLAIKIHAIGDVKATH